MNNHINSKTGVDLVAIAQNLPDISKPTDFVATTFNLDTVALRNEMYIKSNELFNNGNELEAYLYRFLGAYISVIEKCEVYSKPLEEKPEVYELILKTAELKISLLAYLLIQKPVNSQTGIIQDCLLRVLILI